jgi:LEA14-like dessication related protein
VGNRDYILIKGLLFSAVLFLFSSCVFGYKEIEFRQINSFNMGKVNDGKVSFNMNVLVHNPNWYKIKIIKGEMDLTLGGNDAGTATLSEKVKLKGNEERDYDVIIEADYRQLTRAILSSGLSALITKKAIFKVKGWIKGRVFVFGKRFPVEMSESIDLNQFKLKN